MVLKNWWKIGFFQSDRVEEHRYPVGKGIQIIMDFISIK